MLHITILGPLRLSCSQQPLALVPGSRAHALLAFLLLHHGRPLERTYLAAQLEPDVPERTARRRLSDALYQLRQVLPPTRFSGDPVSVALVLQPEDYCDLIALEALLAQPPEQLDPLQLLATPAPLLGPELDYEWLLPARENLHLRLLNALEQSATHAAARHAWPSARDLLQRLLQLEPLRDSAQPALLRAYAALGATNEGRQQYEQWRSRLQTEFALSPDPASERAYAALCRRPAPAALLPASMPLVGRDDERRQIMTWLERTSGRASLILVEGGPGIGKSHLLAHVADDARWRDWAVAQASATHSGSTIERAMQPLLTPLQYEQLAAQLPPVWFARLRMLFGWGGGEARRGGGEEARRGGGGEERDTADNPYALPPSDAAANEPRRYDELILRLLEGLTQHAPLLLILDDLHAAAANDLALLPQLASLRPHQPLVVIMSYRSSVRDDSERWPQFLRLASLASGRMRLAPLAEAACTALLQQSLGPCSHALVSQLHQASGGYPLLLREALHLLLEQNALQRAPDGRWRTTPDHRTMPQLHDLDQTIGCRLDHLAANAHMLLGLIALHGQALGVSQLAHSTGWTPQCVIAEAQALIQRHLLRTDAAGYSCSHDLIDQAIRERLSASERQHYHKLLYAALCASGSSNAQSLGQHAFGAHQWADAIPHLLQAAYELRERADYRTALRVIDQVLEGITQDEDRCSGYTHWRSAALFERIQIWRWYPPPDPKTYTHDLATLAQLLPAAGQQRHQLAIERINHLLDQGHNQAALEQATDELAQLDAKAHPALAARLHCQAGKAAQYLGFIDISISYLRQGQTLASACGAVAIEVAATGNLAIFAHFAGNFSAAREGYNHVLQRCEEYGLIMDSMIARANLASLDHAQGHISAALTGYERVVSSLERYAAVDPPDLENLAEIYIQIGAFSQAETLLDQASALWAERGGGAAMTHCRRVTLALARQDLPEAAAQLNELHTHLGNDQRAAGEAALWQSLLALEQGQWAAAEPLLAQAEAIYDQMGVRFYHALLYAMRALAAARQGQSGAAQESLAHADAALSERLPTFVDPRYLMGLSAESLGAATHADGYFSAAWAEHEAHAAALSPELAQALGAAPYSQRLLWAMRRQRANPSHRIRLPLKGAPIGRPLHPWEEVAILWELPSRPASANAVTWRQDALRSLIAQAHHQEASASLNALAEALGVSMATISRELQALRASGEILDTRGGRK
ncbi:MAG: HTH domain-containing protein [Candidatus Viridilinea halotolerans]|uniref:HTH domain-containing protein n=1 Tax=Candidatus Viridilinea halotolerans TaxID=2491704 RepID=A0A426U583_9CHLR|nr:MAG: HTH domain-containing protein [Candidatus Viridilinea halotolerans]